MKVQEEMPTGVWEMYERYRKALHVYGTPSKTYQRQEGILRTLNRAILEHRVVEIEYQAPEKPATTRNIEPYGLIVYQSSIYVVAAAEEIDDPDQRVRHWKLDRFSKATALDRYFKPDPEVDVEKHLKKGIGIFSGDVAVHVSIELTGRAAGWVREDPWHPEQSLEKVDETTWKFVVPASHPRELLPRVLSLGEDAEVLDPPEFRDAVRDAAMAMAARYQVPVER